MTLILIMIPALQIRAPDKQLKTKISSKEIIHLDVDSIPKSNTKSKSNRIHIPVTITKYNPVASQCNGNPMITADCSKIDIKKLNTYQLRWLAVSRDLLSFVSMGDIIIVKCSNPRLNGEWEVHDVMNKRFSNKIDLLVPENDNYQFHSPLEGHIQILLD